MIVRTNGDLFYMTFHPDFELRKGNVVKAIQSPDGTIILKKVAD